MSRDLRRPIREHARVSRRARSCLCLVAALSLLAGCGGGKDLIDDSLSSPDQIRSLVQQFQTAMEKRDDGTACNLMNEQLRESTIVPGASPDSVESHCSIEGAVHYPGERSSLRTARIVEIRPDRHDQLADVYLDNGSRFRLRREGESADGEWRVYAINFHAFTVPRAKVVELKARKPACGAAMHSLSRLPISPATGEHGARFLWTNRKKQSCLLSGYPRIEFFSRDVPLPFRYRDGGSPYLPKGTPETILVPSRAPATFLAVKYRCDAGSIEVSDEIRVTLPGDTSQSDRQKFSRSTSEFEYCRPFHGSPADDPGNTVAVSPFLASVRDLYDK
jgi:hypothetical protein